jgi:hypothetical protein
MRCDVMNKHPTPTQMTGVYRAQESSHTDRRIRYLKECLQSMKVIKMYGWESSFAERIREARELEIETRKKGAYLEGKWWR